MYTRHISVAPYVMLSWLKWCAMYRRFVYPFTAIVGLEKAKKALLAVAVNPLIGGVLLRGDKGTGKTTLVRGLASVLPEIEVVANCPFNCNPCNPLEMCDNCYRRWSHGEELSVVKKKMKVIDLPLSITPDRLIGTIDVEKALREGVKVLKPGILAEANRNILYIDEVNLLDDYIADLILDAAAYGWNIIEREHISFKHPARFILIGSMNPEEGELRPQLLDRFGLVVNIGAPMDPDARAEIARRVEEFSVDPLGFTKKYEPLEKELKEKIIRARELLPKVVVDDDLLKMLAKTLVDLKIRTCRAEITVVKTAKALAALNGRTHVTLNDIKEAMELALPHRLELKPFQQPQTLPNMDQFKRKNDKRQPGHNHMHHHKHHSRGDNSYQSRADELGLQPRDNHHNNYSSIGNSATVIPPADNKLGVSLEQLESIHEKTMHHRGSRYIYQTLVNKHYGVPISYIYPVPNPSDIDVAGTLTNMVVNRASINDLVKHGLLDDVIAVKIRRSRVPQLAIIALDTSGSMNVLKRIAIAKRIAWEILENSYTRRTWVSLITFRGNGVDIYIPPTRNYAKVLNVLEKTPSGGRTPLPAALERVVEVARSFRSKYPCSYIETILITDGKANKPLHTSVEEELRTYSALLYRENIDLIIYDTRSRAIEPSISYIDLISSITRAKVYKIN